MCRILRVFTLYGDVQSTSEVLIGSYMQDNTHSSAQTHTNLYATTNTDKHTRGTVTLVRARTSSLAAGVAEVKTVRVRILSAVRHRLYQHCSEVGCGLVQSPVPYLDSIPPFTTFARHQQSGHPYTFMENCSRIPVWRHKITPQHAINVPEMTHRHKHTCTRPWTHTSMHSHSHMHTHPLSSLNRGRVRQALLRKISKRQVHRSHLQPIYGSYRAELATAQLSSNRPCHTASLNQPPVRTAMQEKSSLTSVYILCCPWRVQGTQNFADTLRSHYRPR